jgi:Glycosyl hydrolase family 12
MRRRAIAIFIVFSGFSGLALAPSGASAAAASNPVWSSSATHASWPSGGYEVNNDEWSADAGPQTIWADSYRHWGVSSTQGPTTDVKVYPDVELRYYTWSTTPSMGNLTSLRSEFQQYMPSGQDNYIAEAAYDIWLNNWRTEVMIWVDNHRQVPIGQLDGTYDIYGEKFQLWQDGSGINAYYAFVLQGKQQNSGYAHILSAPRILVARGDIPSDSTVTDLEFGWEICSTDNHPLSFTVDNYAVWTGLK